MDYKVGERVVYPHHGVAVVEALQELTIGGAQWPCYQLRILSSNTVAVVPLRNARTVGLRRTADRREVAAVIERLGAAVVAATRDWKERFKENSERMRSGRLDDLAEVLKSLTAVAASRTLSFREKLMLDKARGLVVGEIAAVSRTSAEAAAAMVERALGGRAASA
jgi:CarD family transcriptional regulator